MPTWLTIEAPPQKKAKITVTPAGGGMVAVKMKAAPGQDLRGVAAAVVDIIKARVETPDAHVLPAAPLPEPPPKPKRAWTGVKEPEKKAEPPTLDSSNPYSLGIERLVWEKDAQGNRVDGHWEPVKDEDYLK
jgi:hypothetical protein